LEALIGVRFHDSQFEKIWSTLLDFLSELFHSNGLAIMRAINEFIAPSDEKTDGFSDLSTLLLKGAHSIGLCAGDTELSGEIEQAVMDIFTERTGPAFDWLAKVCERFVALCALGLEATSAEEVRRIVRRNHIVLDSHIILTLLCPSERDYDAVRALISRWRSQGGRILLARPVLEEVAHHAWISENEFRETEHLLGKLAKTELRRYVANAFVRAFHGY